MKTIKAIRQYCLDCSNYQPLEIKECPSNNCFLYSFRFGKNESQPRISSLKAIKQYCFDCSGNSYKEVRSCPFTNCPLFPFRLGKNPNRKGIGNKKGNREAIKKYRNCSVLLNSGNDLESRNKN